ncbi:fibroblast growth factor 16-like [Ptychodera flava]|uniref:fibroblast growth factor 16-like n=1 Tax=Ptychodera flava TaxID=63121 RepID=UPI00396A0569
MELSIAYITGFFTVLSIVISTSSAHPVSDSTGRLLAALFPDELVREPRSSPNYKKLYCSTGYHLEVLPDGSMRGVRGDGGEYSVFEVESPRFGWLAFRSVATGLYLGMDEDGDMYTTELHGPLVANFELCFKVSPLDNLFIAFSSMLYPQSDPAIFRTADASSNQQSQYHLAIDKSGM